MYLSKFCPKRVPGLAVTLQVFRKMSMLCKLLTCKSKVINILRKSEEFLNFYMTLVHVPFSGWFGCIIKHFFKCDWCEGIGVGWPNFCSAFLLCLIFFWFPVHKIRVLLWVFTFLIHLKENGMQYWFCSLPFSFRWIKKVPDIHGIDKNFEIALFMYKEGQKKKGEYKLVIPNVISHTAS